MLRLADRIVLNWIQLTGAEKFIANCVCESPVFIVDDLMRAYVNTHLVGMVDTGERFPCVSFDGLSGLHKLPHNTTFIEGFAEHEWKDPSWRKYGKWFHHYGALAIEHDVSDAWNHRDYCFDSELREEYTWRLQKGCDFKPAFITKIFGISGSRRGLTKIDTCIDVMFDLKGEPYPFVIDYYYGFDRHPGYRNLQSDCAGWNPFTLMVLTTTALLNCSNVESREAEEFSMPDKWHRRTKTPGIAYKVLRISRSRKRTKSAASSTLVTESETPLHTCRGHFKTYTEDKPLFGRVAGTVWCPSHVRGDIKHGSVVKDYRVDIQK